MPRFRKGRAKKAGLPPGTLVYVGEERLPDVTITLFAYDEHRLQEQEVKTVEECLPFREKPGVTWINVDGIQQVEVLEKLGAYFGLHPLVLEDIVNTEQRPKVEDFGEYLYLVLKMVQYQAERHEIVIEQVSLVLGKDFVLSFQEQAGDVFQPVRERLRSGKGRIRKMGADYLAYALVDAIVDHYFLLLENLGEQMEDLEEELITHPMPETLHTIHKLKREMLFLRRSIWPLREVISGLSRGESPLIQKTTGVFLRDVYDHTVQVIDTIETFRDMLSGMLDIYLSSVSNRLNEVMKVLTIIATIFIPLTFIAGIYGMNFKYMPELEWHWGYPVVLLLMLGIACVMLIYFRKKQWL
ncbi:MAG: magnesium and cobalt transport protein CorA [Nitrospinota bacterium]|nr:MAG: magnesium and cobalt transport protein CorA [Nitrospinota bacterium]